MEDKAVLCLPFAKILLEFPVIGLGKKDLTALVATGSHMIKGAFIFNAYRSSQSSSLLRSTEEGWLTPLTFF